MNQTISWAFSVLGVVFVGACGPAQVSKRPLSSSRAAGAETPPQGEPREQDGGGRSDRSPPRSPEIEYSVQQEPEGDGVGIVARRDGEAFVVFGPWEGACLEVLIQKDLDEDGLTDAVIENALSCGGNLTPPDFMYVAGTIGDHFETHELGSQWERPELQTWQGRPSIVIASDNEGMNLARPKQVTRRFIFERGRPTLAEQSSPVEMKALANLRSEQFEDADPDAERRLSFDLDENGQEDSIVGTLWARWGRINWHVRFSDGHLAEGDFPACKRIGVLQQKTRGHHDLVCDFDTQFRWNGKTYTKVP